MFPFSSSYLYSYTPLLFPISFTLTPCSHLLQISNQVWIYHTNFDKLTERMWHVCHCYFDLLFSTWFSYRCGNILTSLVLPLIFHMFCTHTHTQHLCFFLSLCVLLSQKHNNRYRFFILLWSSNEFSLYYTHLLRF